MADPSGVCWRYKGVAIGKTRQAAKTEMEKIKLGEINCDQAIKECMKVVHSVRDENQSHKEEKCWIPRTSGPSYRFKIYPDSILYW